MNNTINKLVCHCKKVSFEDIENAVANGAKSFEEVQEITKVGTGCGRCLTHAKDVTESILAKK